MYYKMKYPELQNVKITDCEWKRYLNLVSDVIIPYQWDILNDRVEDAAPSHCLDNFRIAAGEMEGEYYGMVFQDTDVYKWLEAVAFSIENGTGGKYEAMADEVIALLEKAQQPDGYLNTYYTIKEPGKRFTNLREGHELYCAGHMMEAAAAYYNATGKEKFLEIAKRFADLLCHTFGCGAGQIHGYPGHQEIEIGLLKLYHVVQDERYLDLVRFFLEERGSSPNYFLEEMKNRRDPGIFPEMEDYDLHYSQSHISPVEQRDAEGHAVRAMYMYAAMAELAEICRDKQFENACDALWDSTVNRRMYITGGVGSSGYLERFTTDYDLPNDRAYCESCASIGLMMFGQRMAAVKRDACYMDIVEKALYNTVLGGISREGNRYFYVNVLDVWPDNCMPYTSMAHVKPVRQKWFDVACCPTNIARTIASVGKYMYSYDSGGVYVNLFISSEAEFPSGDGKIKIYLESDLARSGRIRLRTEATDPNNDATLYIRVPSYAKKAELKIDGKGERMIAEKGYLAVSGAFGRCCSLEIDFGIENEWIMANPLVRADAGKTALMRGPYVYCLEEADNGKNLSSVYVEPDTAVEEAEAPDVPGSVPCLRFRGKRMKAWENGELYRLAGFEFEDAEFKAVPYYLWGNRTEGEMSVWQKLLLG